MIEHVFVFQNNLLSAKVRCPKCQKIGYLNLLTGGSKRKFQIVHLEKFCRKRCRFGWTSEFYEELEKIYNELEYKRQETLL